MFKSQAKANFNGKHNTQFYHDLREKIGLEDNNEFVSNFVIYSIISAANLKTINLNVSSFSIGVDTILRCRDKNYPMGVPIYNFWTQKLVNGTWEAYPENFLGTLAEFSKLP